MNDVLSFILYGLAVLPGSGPLDPGIEGRWVREALPAAACRAGGEGALVVTLRDFALGGTRCSFGGVLPPGVQAVGGDMACTGAGEAFRHEARVMHRAGPAGRPEEERLFLAFGRTRPSAYRRC